MNKSNDSGDFMNNRDNPVSINEMDLGSLPLVKSSDLINLDNGVHETEWLVDELMPTETLISLSAPPSHYKTWLALYLGRSSC